MSRKRKLFFIFFFQRIRYLTLPTQEWGPALVKHRRLVDYVPGFIVDPWGTGTKNEKMGVENFAAQFTANPAGIKVNE